MIALAATPPIIDLLDDLMVLIPLIMIVIALALHAFMMVRIVGWSGRDTAAADDPYFFAFGEMPTLPDQVSAGAHQRNESGGRTASSPRSSAAALTSSKGARHV